MPSTAAISASRIKPKMREISVRPPTESVLRKRLMDWDARTRATTGVPTIGAGACQEAAPPSSAPSGHLLPPGEKGVLGETFAYFSQTLNLCVPLLPFSPGGRRWTGEAGSDEKGVELARRSRRDLFAARGGEDG